MATRVVGFGKPELKQLAADLTATCTDRLAHGFGLEPQQAHQTAKRLVKTARKMVDGQALVHEPPRRGQRRLDQVLKSRRGQRLLKMLKREGVRERDFVRWWDLHVLEQEVMRRLDSFEQEQFVERLAARNLPLEYAELELRRQYPVFGPPPGSMHSVNPHAPLPDELRPRVQAYLARADPATVRKEAKRCLSLNAYLRELITQRKL